MNLSHLRVYNVIYKLGITEEEFAKLEKEFNDKEKTGLFYLCKKNDYVVGVLHDFYTTQSRWNHNNEWKEKKLKVRSKIVIHHYRDLPLPCRILCKTIITFNDIPKEIYDLHRLFKYRSEDSNTKYVANSLDELKSIIIKRLNNSDRIIEDEDYKQLKNIFWLFDEKYEKIDLKIRKNFKTIVKVFENNNRRTAIMFNSDVETKQYPFRGRYEVENRNWEVATYTPRDEEYNYVDVGREIYNDRIWVSDEIDITNKELEIIDDNLNEEIHFFFLSKFEYEQRLGELRTELLVAKRNSNLEKMKKRMKSKVLSEFKKKGIVTRNGITYTNDSISYNGIKLKNDRIEDFIEKASLLERENPDFNDILSTFVEWVLDIDIDYGIYGNSRGKTLVNFIGKETIWIGKVKIDIERKEKNCYLNGRKTRRIDLIKAITSAVFYQNQLDYDDFIKEVSKCNFDTLNAIKNGLSFKIQVKKEKDEDNVLVKNIKTAFIGLKLVRENGKNYLDLGDKKIVINNMPLLLTIKDELKIFSYNDGNSLNRSIRILTASMKDLTPADIQSMVERGMEEFSKREERSKEFLRMAIETTKAEEFRKGDIEGYIVEGTSGKKYLIKDDAKVWEIEKVGEEIKTKRYVCIIDEDYGNERDEAETNDLIARRLYSLKNDIATSKHISTLDIDNDF